MPELAEVEIVCRGIDRLCAGATLTAVTLSDLGRRSCWNGPLDVGQLNGLTISRAVRWGKRMCVQFESGPVLTVGLGMTGTFTVGPGDRIPAKHDHLRLDLQDGRSVVFNDARRFGSLHLHANLTGRDADLGAKIGVDLLDPQLTGQIVKERLGETGLVFARMLEQRLVAGGGAYNCQEALFFAGVRPDRHMSHVTEDDCDVLLSGWQVTVREAIDRGGMTMRDYADAEGNAGTMQNFLKVYGRGGQPCVTCSIPLQTGKVTGRTVTFCASCQR